MSSHTEKEKNKNLFQNLQLLLFLLPDPQTQLQEGLCFCCEKFIAEYSFPVEFITISNFATHVWGNNVDTIN